MDYKIADKLIEQRKKHGFSQEELAGLLSISRQAVSKWERAEAAPDTENLIALSKLYGITIDEILGLDNRTSDSDNAKDTKDYSDNSFFRLSKKDRYFVKFLLGLIFSIVGFAFVATGLGMYLGFAVPETNDLKFSKNENLAVQSVTITDISLSALTINNNAMYRIVFILDGNTVETNPIYTEYEARSKIGEIIEVRTDGKGKAVMLNYKKSAYSTLGVVFLSVFGSIGIISLPIGVILLYLAKTQKRQESKE